MKDVGVRRHRECGPRATRPVESVHPVMVARCISSTAIRPGTVVLARVAYAEVSDYKIRPVVVLENSEFGVTVLPLSGSVRQIARPGAWLIRDLASAGLPRASAVFGKPRSIHSEDVVDICGRLGSADWDRFFPGSAAPVAA